MHWKSILSIASLLGLATAPGSGAPRTGPALPTWYSGMCDGSAAAAIDSNLFAVANDEDSVIRVYNRSKGGPPIARFDVTAFLELGKKSPETDLEGAARIGDQIYWIGSHGRSKNGGKSPSRRRLFATQIVESSGGFELKPTGRPYAQLIDDMAADPRLARFELKEAAKQAPKTAGALSIEGLSATPQGGLLIGFRNPTPGGKALIVPLSKPAEVITGKLASFGDPILLDLGGLGIRDMALENGTYYILGGSSQGGPGFRVYEWRLGGMPPRALDGISLAGFRPESIVFFPGAARSFHLLSDDGGQSVGGKDCKDIRDPQKRRFRGFELPL